MIFGLQKSLFYILPVCRPVHGLTANGTIYDTHRWMCLVDIVNGVGADQASVTSEDAQRHVDGDHPTAASVFRAAISSFVRFRRSFSTISECSPRMGAGEWISGGVSERLIGEPITLTGPATE